MKLRRIILAPVAVAALALPAVASASGTPVVHHALLLPAYTNKPTAIQPLDVDGLAICDTTVRDDCIESSGNYHNVDYGSKFTNTSGTFAVNLKAANICAGDNKVTATCPFTNHSIDASYLGDYIQTIQFWDAGTDNQYVTSNGGTGQAWDAPAGSTASPFVDNPIGTGGNFRMINVWFTNFYGAPIYLASSATQYQVPLTLSPSPLPQARYTWFHEPFVPTNPMAPVKP